MTEPEWGDFKVLLALGRAGSVAGAARILGVDGSTVSRRLAAAEKAAGAILIVRGGRAFAFTKEGRRSSTPPRPWRPPSPRQPPPCERREPSCEGLVRLAVVPSMAQFLGPFPGIVATRHPDLHVELHAGRGATDLAKGEADIAVRVVRDAASDLIMRHTFDLGFAFYASTGYLELGRAPEPGRGSPRSQARPLHGRVPVASLRRVHRAVRRHRAAGDAASTASRRHASMIAADAGIGVLWCCHGDSLAHARARPARPRLVAES